MNKTRDAIRTSAMKQIRSIIVLTVGYYRDSVIPNFEAHCLASLARVSQENKNGMGDKKKLRLFKSSLARNPTFVSLIV